MSLEAQAKAQLLMLKGIVADLPQEHQDQIKATAEKLRDVLNGGGEFANLAMGIVALESQVKGGAV